MKRILVVDESRAVRETIALVLRREFTISQRSPLADSRLLAPEESGVDLLILGAPAGLRGGSAILNRVAAQCPCPVLFLLSSRAAAVGEGASAKIDYLVKPFNPYELKEKTGRLLGDAAWSQPPPANVSTPRTDVTRFVDFPYLPAPASAAAKCYAVCKLPVLIVGEVGSRQEEVARALHALGPRSGPWIAAYGPELTRENLRNRLQSVAVPEAGDPRRATLFLSGLEGLEPTGQSSLLRFLAESEAQGWELWTLCSSWADLLERVYRREFLDTLYYRLATLILRLPPLRERPADLPALAAELAEDYGARLGLGKVGLSQEAIDRLSGYLWFGNLAELETVIARTLARSRKQLIEAGDLVFDVDQPVEVATALSAPSEASPSRTQSAKDPEPSTPGASEPVARPRLGNGDYRDIRVLINELAHELKNPMVTIKTFTQLLDDRYDDEAFRDRFQETVGNDIERMDELLEMLLDFSRFRDPARERVYLHEQLRRVLEEILPECGKREATIRWGRKEESSEVVVDKEQFHYALCNVLRTALGQIKPQGEIQVDVEAEGKVVVGYVQEGGQMRSLSQFLELSSAPGEDEGLPLRVHLARILLQRIGGGLAVNRLEGGKILIRADLPVG